MTHLSKRCLHGYLLKTEWTDHNSTWKPEGFSHKLASVFAHSYRLMWYDECFDFVSSYVMGFLTRIWLCKNTAKVGPKEIMSCNTFLTSPSHTLQNHLVWASILCSVCNMLYPHFDHYFTMYTAWDVWNHQKPPYFWDSEKHPNLGDNRAHTRPPSGTRLILVMKK